MLKEISPGCSLEGLMLKLKLQYFGHLMQRAESFEKTLMLGKIEGRRRRGRQRMRWLDGTNDSMDEFEWTPGVSDGQGGLACCNSWAHRVGHDWATELKRTPYILCSFKTNPQAVPKVTHALWWPRLSLCLCTCHLIYVWSKTPRMEHVGCPSCWHSKLLFIFQVSI